MGIEVDIDNWAKQCNADGEFAAAARHWQGGITLEVDGEALGLTIVDGQAQAGVATGSGVVKYSGSAEVWQEMLRATPTRFHNDLMANISAGGGLRFERAEDSVAHAQYYPRLCVPSNFASTRRRLSATHG